MNRWAVALLLMFLSFSHLPAWAAPTERKVTIQYTEPDMSMCPALTQLKPVSSPVLCLEALGSETQQKTCNATKNQAFEMVEVSPAGSGLFQLKSSMTRKCLRMGSANGDAIIETSCANAAGGGGGAQDQIFRIGPSPSAIQSNSGAGGLCLDIAGASTIDGAKLQSWGCHGGTNQSFAYALTEPNKCPLLDLAKTRIYRDVVMDGDPGVEIDVPASAKTGGGTITKAMCVPIKDDQTAVGIHFQVTAIDESGNESDKTPEVVWQVAGTPDCTIVVPDTTPPAIPSGVHLVNP